MPRRYRDIYPTPPQLSSTAFARQPASALMTVNHFRAPPATMATGVFAEHHILMNLHSDPMRVQNMRNGRLVDVAISRYDVFITPAGMETGWRWFDLSDVIVATLDPNAVRKFVEKELDLVLSEQQFLSVAHAPDKDLCDAGLMVCDTLQTNDLASATLFEALARVFLVKLIQRYGDPVETDVRFRGRFTTRHYRMVLDHIRGNLSTSISLSDLAEVVGM